MKAHQANRQRGFTIHEVVVTVSLLALALLSSSKLFGSNQDLSNETRAHQRAEAEHRRNLRALSKVLRTADIQTLDGFDLKGISTNPHFYRVTGAALNDRTYGGDEQLLWMPAPRSVPGVERPGAVYLVRDGHNELVADRVPAGGFSVEQQGQNLLIHLTTYYMTSARRLVKTASTAVVSLRN
jgi:hypothetical protein